MAAGGKPKLLQRLQVELENDRVGRADEAHLLRPLEIRLVGVLVEALLGRQMMVIEAAVGDVLLELLRVRRALAVALAVGAAEAGQRADARRTLVVRDVIG